MPHVTFQKDTAVSRLPTEAEQSAMHKFARHCSHCRVCEDPWATYQAGESLCERGHERALVVTEYIFYSSGKAYSPGTREDDYVPVRVEVPGRYEAVRGLLRAVEDGMRLRRGAPKKKQEDSNNSYDRTYYVPERIVERPYYKTDYGFEGRKRERRYHDEQPRYKRENDYYDERFHR